MIMRTRVSGSKHIYYTPAHPEEHCSDHGHVWTWDRRNMVQATGEQRRDARCDCGEALWKDVLTKMAKPNRVADVCPKCGKELRYSLNGRERACSDQACAWCHVDAPVADAVTAERERIAAWLERQQVNGWTLKSLADDLRRNDL